MSFSLSFCYSLCPSVILAVLLVFLTYSYRLFCPFVIPAALLSLWSSFCSVTNSQSGSLYEKKKAKKLALFKVIQAKRQTKLKFLCFAVFEVLGQSFIDLFAIQLISVLL